MSEKQQDVQDAYENGVRCVLATGEFRDATGEDDICGERFDEPEEWIEHVKNEHKN